MGSANDLVGHLIGPWRIEARIGEGGLASVYRAVHSRVGSRAAIKVLAGEHAVTSEWAERMVVEAQLVNRIGSPHIVKIIDLLATADGRPALVMELLEGATLASLLSLPPTGSLLVVILDVLEALAMAHEHAVIHRDIKPSNIFVSPDGRGTLLDFGIAKLTAPGSDVIKTQAGAALGTPRYMAPEQLTGEPIGPATDLYAIGEVLFEELTGEGPFGEATGDALMERKLAEAPRSLAATRADLPAKLAALVDRALARNPTHRWSSATAMAEALRAVLSELPESAFEAIALPSEPTPDARAPQPTGGVSPPAVAPALDVATIAGKKPALGNVGPYRLEAVLGEGGAGTVYRAYDPRLRRHVALKVFHATSSVGGERFLAEARAHARLNHPNVCRIFEIGEAAGAPYLAMQLLSGRTLADAAPQLERKQAVGLLVECGRALQAVHSLGLVHRDVKPANVLVEVDEHGVPHAYLTDFGLVRTVGDAGVTTAGTIVGTPRYMAPEQLAGNPTAIDARTDVYALGATLYEVLTGRPAFDGQSSVELMFQISTQDPIEPRRLVPSLPRDLETIVMKCLAKAPARRYGSTGELVADLEHWLRDEPISARPPALTERLRRAAKRHRVLFSSLAVAGVIGTMATATEVWRWQRDRRELAIVDAVSRDAAHAREQLRSAYLLPLHDLAPERAVINGVIGDILRQSANARPSLRARLLLEAGALQLDEGDPQRARSTLDEASRIAPTDPELQRRYGEAMLRLYIGQLGELDSHDDLKRVARQREQLAATERAAGRALRERGHDDGVGARADDRLLEGEIAVAEAQYDAAVRIAKELLAERPLWAEAVFLEAHATKARADALHVNSDTARAKQTYEAAITRYRDGLAIARSHPDGWGQLCQALNALILNETIGGKDAASRLAETRIACGNARRAKPNVRRPVAAELWAIAHYADWVVDHGNSAKPLCEEAEQLFTSSGSLGRTSPAAIAAMISLVMAVADEEAAAGHDPTSYLHRGLALIDDASKLGPIAASLEEARGGFYGRQSMWEARNGRSPVAALERGIEANRRAIALDPLAYLAYGNIATSALLLCDYEVAFGTMRAAVLDGAIAAGFALVNLHPGRALGYERLGESFWYHMKGRLMRDVDPAPLQPQLNWPLEAALRLKPDLPYAWLNLGDAHRLVAEYRVRHGVPLDDAALTSGRDAIQKATAIDAKNPTLWLYLARLEAVWASGSPRTFEAHARAAEAAIARALAIDPKEPDALEVAAQIALVRLWHPAPSATDAARRALAERGVELASKSLAIRPGIPRTMAIHATLLAELALCSHAQHDPKAATDYEAQSREELARAFAANPTLRLDFPPRAAVAPKMAVAPRH